LLISAFAEISSFIIVKVLHGDNIFIYNLYTLLEIWTLGSVYGFEFFGKTGVHLWFFLLLSFILVIDLIAGDFLSEILNSTEPLLFCLLSIFYFYRYFNSLQFQRLLDKYFFFLNLAVMFYFGITSLILMSEGYLRTTSFNISAALWIIHLIANICYHFIFTFSIWKSKQT
jgi:hypothetical protein